MIPRHMDYFISCDWGTSNFRLRLVKTSSLEILHEHRTDHGVRAVFQQYSNQNNLSQVDFFAEYLAKQVRTLPHPHQQQLVVLSGMASSNIGLMELEYAEMPFDLSGKGLHWKRTTLENGLDILLVSGVKCQTGMMRGEEVQAIGMESCLQDHHQGILILPGTHSKHITFEKGAFTDLKTFMTGELFDIISSKSILANSVSESPWNGERERSFVEGLLTGADGKMTAGLFGIRAKHVIENASRENNYYLLSGMLIGDELLGLKTSNIPIFIAATGRLALLYQLAVKTLLGEERLISLGDSNLEKALLIGQRKILMLHGE
ncbi:MAG: 2-dehydro-3-deoxygalactonokinase [Cyclobacteriaceae bacterium]|nr:MAG: 2-dehydro-3-deoxygalactonokinase [Cyclobacteriaceae bacterium]